MNHLKPLAALALGAAVFAPAGSVSANSNMPDANCAGLVFTMPRGEEGTIVRTFLDGSQIRSDTIARHGDPLSFTIASPDQTVGHVWTVTVDSVWNTDQSWSETVPVCQTPPTTATTVPPAPTTTAVVATSTPPVVSSTVVTTPRTPTTSTPPVPTTTPSTVPGMLPETGPGAFWGAFALIASFIVGVGATLVLINGKRSQR